MDNKFFNLALIGILFSINACVPSKDIIMANPLPDWWDTRGITVSQISYIRPGPYMIINYDYFVNEIKYQGSFAPPSGDYSYSYDINYEIAYNPNNPKEHFLLEYRRVIDYEKLDGVTLTIVTASKHITLRKKRPELLINGMTANALFGTDHKKIKVLTLGHRTSPSNDLETLSFFIEHHDTMLYYQNFQHKVYLMSYDKSNPINSLLHYEYPVGLEKYSWTRMMNGKVTNSKLRKIQRMARRLTKKHGKGAVYYYINGMGNLYLKEQEESMTKLRRFKPKNKKGNDLDVDIHIVTDDLINRSFEEYQDFLKKQKN